MTLIFKVLSSKENSKHVILPCVVAANCELDWNDCNDWGARIVNGEKPMSGCIDCTNKLSLFGGDSSLILGLFDCSVGCCSDA